MGSQLYFWDCFDFRMEKIGETSHKRPLLSNRTSFHTPSCNTVREASFEAVYLSGEASNFVALLE